MTGARVEIDDRAIREHLGEAARAGVKMEPLLDDIGAALKLSTQRRFETESGPGGTKWAPFSAKTLRRMRRDRKPPKLLRDTARLYQSITLVVTGGAVMVGTNVTYAGVHQFGDTIDQPARTQTATFTLARQGAGKKTVTDEDGTTREIRVGSKLRFAKASTRLKSRHERTFDVGARSFTVPARPFLGVDAADRAEIHAIVDEHIGRAFEARPGAAS